MRQASMNEIRGDNGPFLLRWCSPQRRHQQAPQEKLTHHLRQNWAPKPGIKTGLPVEMAHKIPTKFDGFFSQGFVAVSDWCEDKNYVLV